ncbi:uncharacterized protein N0V89_000600 [Didymosphaeria variabile]|uniref:Uncharacterized protein n=1 Tax=Didymosphaeria variabile TaxID=1932322 RepID=A0A9W8XVM1_9PLEO|nr:uncharacterized protein N0V89_000600 [Didymosphaeria variabile]KAJ4360041.1 hypothetical protein N0V89_000600 [Didymosphaeria variabile]
MPGFFTSPSLQRCDSRPHLYEPVTRFPPVSSETSGLQVTEGDDHATRKRSRYENPDLQNNAFTFRAPSPNTNPWSHPLSNSRSSVRSPPPLANDRYELAGGMEVTDKFARQNGNLDDYFHLEKQRGMWSTPISPNSGIPPHLQPTELQVTPASAKPWMLNQLMNIVGGVAGKLYQFCSVPFRGFQAGGGQAYAFENQEVAAKLGLQDDYSLPKGPTPQTRPIDYRDNDFGVESIESLKAERPGAKRQRTAESWVVVDNQGDIVSRPSTPRMAARRVPSQTRSPSHIPRPVSRASMTTPVHKRPSLIPVSRRSTLDKTTFYGSVKTNSQSPGHVRSYSRQSYGSPLLFNDKPSKKKSPLPPESQRLISKMRREEDEDDARMRRMSSQMSAMLREAREALGSKFETEDEYMEEDDDDVNDSFNSSSMPLFSR